MRRFIRYLYEYRQGQRVRNIGFVKVEQDEKVRRYISMEKECACREIRAFACFFFIQKMADV